MSSLAVCGPPSFKLSYQWQSPPACGHIKQGTTAAIRPHHEAKKLQLYANHRQ